MTKQATNPDELMLIGAIRQHANANYNNGWGYVVECWSDGDILEVLSDCEANLPQAIAHIQSMVDLHESLREEHEAEARAGL